nr:hypothetical protein BaRGS_001607 [Batillaria attramentaria]
MGQECCKTPWYLHVKRLTTRVFRQYGEFVGHHPVPFIVLPILVFGSLGAGVLLLQVEDDTEKLYFPKDSRAFGERDKVVALFPDRNRDNYNMYAQNIYEEEGVFIFQPKNETDSIFSPAVAAEIHRVINMVTSFKVSGGLRYDEFCARYNGSCIITGMDYVTPRFLALVAAGKVTYPLWADPATGQTRDLSLDLAKVTTLEGGILKEARMLKTNFILTRNHPHSVQWQFMFLEFAQNYLETNFTSVSYKMLYSLAEELDKATKGDLFLFGLAIMLVVVYAWLVTMGGDAVSTRAMLALAGVLAASLSIVGSVGLLCLCGFKFSNIVGIMPYLIIGIGVDDMFLIMSSWSDLTHDHVMHVPQRVGATLALAGVGITVTSLTDLLAFLIGGNSVFYCVQSFCLYTGIAVLFCYISNVTLFVGCLSLHGRRVFSARHFITCRPTKPRDQLVREGRSRIYAIFVGGSVPKANRDDESLFEQLPRRLLPKVIESPVIRIFVLLGFACFLGFSLYGVVNLKQGLQPQNLISTKSYLHRYITLKEHHFPDRLPVGFVIEKEVNYSSAAVQNLVRRLLSSAAKDPDTDDRFERCWLMSYVNSSFYSEVNFTGGLLGGFLRANPTFWTDLTFDVSGQRIVASRCYAMSVAIRDQYAQAELMTRMRSLADGSPLPVFAFHYSFVTFEQYLSILPATVKTVGLAVVAMVIVCLIFLPHPLMVVLVTLNILMILCGIFGFMAYWDITLSAVTMILLIMSVGFSVDFSAHVCTAYLMSNAVTRVARAQDAITHAASPIFNGGISSLVGVVILLASDTYIFTTFFKIMFLVILFGVLNAVFFMPVVLSLIGPENRPLSKEDALVAYGSKENRVNACIAVNGATDHRVGDEKLLTDHTDLMFQAGDYKDKTGIFEAPGGRLVLNGAVHVDASDGLLIPNGTVSKGHPATETHSVKNGIIPGKHVSVSPHKKKDMEEDWLDTDVLLNHSLNASPQKDDRDDEIDDDTDDDVDDDLENGIDDGRSSVTIASEPGEDPFRRP